MLLYPEVQHKAQAEIDLVVGSSRLPKPADRPKLRYTNALLHEVLRWHPVTPLGLPHKVMQEDEYRGYRIPAGSTVWANIWSVLHDPQLYPDPSEFQPERYMDNCNEHLNPDPRSFAFGFGKRACPGRNVAEDTLFLLIATVLATCDISKAIDHNGVPIEPEVDYTGMIYTAGPFGCRIAARSTEAEQLVKASALATRHMFYIKFR